MKSAVVRVTYNELRAGDISRQLEKAFGPKGTGAIAIAEVPGFSGKAHKV